MEDILYTYWLLNIEGIGDISVQKLLDYASSPREIWNLTKENLEAADLDLKSRQISAIISSKDESKIKRSYENICKKNIKFYPLTHPDYPQKLKNIANPPHAVYFKGRLPDDDTLSIAVVGARNCSEYGRYLARKIGTTIGSSHIQLISGMARGIDSIAQGGALDAGGYSCAVLGCGVDICYPPESRKIYDIMSTAGCILSEYHPGTEPKPGLFPLRNRIISGLADVIVVIEARESSGSLITADAALEQGRDVYALPGRVTDSLSRGCNRLIKQGAGILLSPEELLQDLAVNYSLTLKINSAKSHSDTIKNDIEKTNQSQGTNPNTVACLSQTDKKILSVLSLTPKSLTVIQSETGIAVGELTRSLLSLSLSGYIRSKDGYYLKA